MCDLWESTLDSTVPVGSIPAQIDYALRHLEPARQIKLYNAGNFFDRRAIPEEDFPEIAARVRSFERVIVESHPSLVGDACERFARLIHGDLEVAMGLETVHPGALEALNKRMTLDSFRACATRLTEMGIALRVFVLLGPPFIPPAEAVDWTCRSIDEAFDCGATACTVIPVRSGNGAVDALAATGHWTPPTLAMLEHSLEYGLSIDRGRVFADTWDVRRLSVCSCAADRLARIVAMNRSQRVTPRGPCDSCEVGE